MRALTFALSLVLIAGCKEPEKQPAPATSAASTAAPAASSTPATPAASTTAASSAAPAASPVASAAPAQKTCEVEIFGEVKVPKTVPEKSRIVVYVAQDDCMSDNAWMLGHIVVANGPAGNFMIEVFPKWGSDVSICAGVDPGDGKPSEIYGKATGKFHAEAEGEVTFNNVKIELKAGKPHRFPADHPKQ